jgi:hypothetical protein
LQADVGGVSSKFRDSKAAAFHWRKELPYTEVQHIQTVCTEAMILWGYLPALNVTHQKHSEHQDIVLKLVMLIIRH